MQIVAFTQSVSQSLSLCLFFPLAPYSLALFLSSSVGVWYTKCFVIARAVRRGTIGGGVDGPQPSVLASPSVFFFHAGSVLVE